MDPGRTVLRPPDPDYIYTPILIRVAGAVLDVIFLHIVLIPLWLPATDLSFRMGNIGPALAFTVAYFGFLWWILWWRGLTPGGIPLAYRVFDLTMRRLTPAAALRRLLPYILIAAVGLWRLHVVVNGFAASGDQYELESVKTYLSRHGGWLTAVVVALNFFVVVDLAHILGSDRNQSWSDILAGSFVVSKASS